MRSPPSIGFIISLIPCYRFTDRDSHLGLNQIIQIVPLHVVHVQSTKEHAVEKKKPGKKVGSAGDRGWVLRRETGEIAI